MATELADRITRVQERLARACDVSGRAESSVTLVAVSKNHPPEAVCEAAALGLSVFGENRVQEARQKIPLCPGRLDWHLVGHLQSNKARLALSLFSTIHSIDSADLLHFVNDIASRESRTLRVFLEVNVSGEGTKFGLNPGEVEAVLNGATKLMNVNIDGLMCMPPFTPDPESARPHFQNLRKLRDALRGSTGFPLPELSMGMSHDFEVAVQEGATLIRVGSDIFGKRPGREE